MKSSQDVTVAISDPVPDPVHPHGSSTTESKNIMRRLSYVFDASLSLAVVVGLSLCIALVPTDSESFLDACLIDAPPKRSRCECFVFLESSTKRNTKLRAVVETATQ